MPVPATAEDGQGVERIVVPDLNADGWTPAPLEPDKDEVARLKKIEKALEQKKTDRLEALKSRAEKKA